MRTEIVKAAFPDQPGFSDQIYSTFPCLEAEDLADLIDYLLSNPRVFHRKNSFVIRAPEGVLENVEILDIYHNSNLACNNTNLSGIFFYFLIPHV